MAKQQSLGVFRKMFCLHPIPVLRERQFKRLLLIDFLLLLREEIIIFGMLIS